MKEGRPRMQMTTMNTSGSPSYEDEVDLRRYRRFVTAHWMILAACVIAGALVAIGIASFLPPRYQASATLLILQPVGGTPLVLTPATAKALLVNPPMVSETINELGLNHDGITAQGLIDGAALEVEPVSATNLVRLSVTLPDPSAARKIASLLASKAVELMNRVEREAPSAERPALEKQLTEADRRLKDAAQRLVEFETSGNLDALDAEIKATDQRRAGADGLRIRLEGERARFSTLEQELAHQPQELRAPLPPGATDQLRAGQNAARVGDSNPLANPVRPMLQYEMALSRATMSRLETQQRRTLAIGTGREATSRRAELYRQQLVLARLRAEYDARTRTYDDLRLRYERTESLTAQLYVVAAPVQPDQPLPRRRRQFASLGAIVGLVCGIVVAAAMEARNMSRRTTP